MTFAVIWTSAAMMTYRRLRTEDRPGATLVTEAVRALADEPRPPSTGSVQQRSAATTPAEPDQ